MFCPKCGHKNTDEATFCIKCGAKISNNSSQIANDTYNQPRNSIINPLLVRLLFILPILTLLTPFFDLKIFSLSGLDLIIGNNTTEFISKLSEPAREVMDFVRYATIGSLVCMAIGFILPNIVTPILSALSYILFIVILIINGGSDSIQIFGYGFYLGLVANIIMIVIMGYNYKESEPKKRFFKSLQCENKKEAIIFLSSVIAGIIILTGWFLLILKSEENNISEESNIKENTKTFAMPNIIDMDFYQALEVYPKLDIQVEATEFSDLEKDKIFEQSIAEGDGVKEGEVVKVKVSLGSKTVKVPNVINYHYITAGEALRAQGLEVEFKYQVKNDFKEETVFDTEPAALEEVPSGSKVIVYVSSNS